jgi:hypothetical protein
MAPHTYVALRQVLDTPEPLRNLADLIAAQLEFHKKSYEILSELAPTVDALQVEQEVSFQFLLSLKSTKSNHVVFRPATVRSVRAHKRFLNPIFVLLALCLVSILSYFQPWPCLLYLSPFASAVAVPTESSV